MPESISLFSLLFPEKSRELAEIAHKLGISTPPTPGEGPSPGAGGPTAPGVPTEVSVAPEAEAVPTAPLTGLPQASPLARLVQPVLMLPVSLRDLARALLSAQAPGISAPLLLNVPILVPAQGSAKFTFNVPQHQVLVIGERLRYTSSYHDANITLQAVVDGLNPILVQWSLSDDDADTLPEFGYIRRQIQLTFTNQSWWDAVVTIRGAAILIDEGVFDLQVLPIVRENVSLVSGRAQQITGVKAPGQV